MTQSFYTPERRVKVTYTMKGVFGTVTAVLHVLKDDTDADIKRNLKQRILAEFEQVMNTDPTNAIGSLNIWDIKDEPI